MLTRYVRLNCRTLAHLNGNEVRTAFIKFFAGNGHQIVPSGSVVASDPTLAFTSAGMNQFKPVILGEEKPQFSRVANSQKCIRTGGKHNDLADVGRDGTHLTFFEMLGNWSFGDYYNKEACRFAWGFLVDVLKIDPRRLYVSFFSGAPEWGLGPDLECRRIWLDLGVRPEHVVPAGPESNFWEMADLGPCGPSTEIHVDRRHDRENAAHLVNVDGSDVVELWNLVFMQYNRRSVADFDPLPVRHIDCGMGFERLVSVIQDVPSNYDTDLFLPLLDKIANLSKLSTKYSAHYGADHYVDTAYRTLADHVRAIPVALAEGVNPSKKRFQSLRAMIRTTIRLSNEVLDMERYALLELVELSIQMLGVAFPDVLDKKDDVLQYMERAEKAYHKKIRESELAFFGLTKGSKPGDVFPAEKLLYAYVAHGLTKDMAQRLAERKSISIGPGFDEMFDTYKVSLFAELNWVV